MGGNKIHVWVYRITDENGTSKDYVSSSGGDTIFIEGLKTDGWDVYGEKRHWQIEDFCKENGLKLSASEYELILDTII